MAKCWGQPTTHVALNPSPLLVHNRVPTWLQHIHRLRRKPSFTNFHDKATSTCKNNHGNTLNCWMRW